MPEQRALRPEARPCERPNANNIQGTFDKNYAPACSGVTGRKTTQAQEGNEPAAKLKMVRNEYTVRG